MDLPLKQSAKAEVKAEEDAGGAATSSSSEEQAAPLDAGAPKAPASLCKVQRCAPTEHTELPGEPCCELLSSGVSEPQTRSLSASLFNKVSDFRQKPDKNVP